MTVLLLAVAVTVVIFCFVNVGRFTDVVWQMPVGFLTGWLFSLQKENNQEVTIPWLVALGLLLVIGSGPVYWRNWVDILGIKKLGDVEFAGADIAYVHGDMQFPTDPDNEKDSTRHDAMQRIIRLTEKSMQWDFCYTMKYGDRYELDASETGDLEVEVDDKCNGRDYSKVLDAISAPGNVVAVKNVSDVLNGTIVRLAQCYENYTFDTNNVGIADALRPFAGHFAETLRLEKDHLKEAVMKDAAVRLRETLIAAMDELRELSLVPPKDEEAKGTCSAPEEEVQWRSLAAFVKNSKTYPYAAIALAHLLDRIGQKKLATEYLGRWISSYKGSTSSMNLVRAHVILSTMISAVGKEKSGEYRLGFLAALDKLLEGTSFLGQGDDGCGEYSSDYFIARLLLLKLSAKNNFVYWSAEIGDTNYVEVVDRFTQAIGQCDASEYISRLLPELPLWSTYISEAYFLDTYAHGIIYLLDQKRRMSDTYLYADRLEVAEDIRKAIAAWTEAQRHLNLFLTKYGEEALGEVSLAAEVLQTIQENLQVAEKRLTSLY